MKRRAALPLLALLAACQAKGPVTPTATTTPRPPRTSPAATNAPTTGPTADAGPTPTALPTVTGGAPSVLRKPTAPSVTVKGRIAVDAGYALAKGASIVKGGVGFPGGRLISQTKGLEGGTGSGIISDNGGSLISDAGAGIISDNGGSYVAAGGAGILSLDGSPLISNNGGGLISNNGGGYRLRQAGPGFGETLPGAGMWVSVVDPATGLTVPLGADEVGRPVYTVFSDQAGAFEVYLPADVAARARIVARPPGGEDAKLSPNAFVVDGQAATLDDDTAVVTAYIRTVTGARLGTSLAAATSDAFVAPLKPIWQAAHDAGAARLSARDQLEVGVLLGDVILVRADLTRVVTTFVGRPTPKDPVNAPKVEGQPAIAVLTDVLRQLREAARAKAAGQADPAAFFMAKPWIVQANMKKPPAERYRVERPADVTEFLMREYLSSTDPVTVDKARVIFDDLGLPLAAWDQASAAADALTTAIATASLSLPAENVATGGALVKAVITRLLAAPAPTPSPDPRPVPAVPTPPVEAAVTVETVAGLGGTAGTADGPGATARFAALAGGIWAEKPVPGLYVADGGAVRRVRFDAAGAATVETLAGKVNVAGSVDGPAAVARFKAISALASDAEGRLVAVEHGNHAIRRLTFAADGAATAETLVGGPALSGFADGPAASAQLKFPTDVAIDAAGDLWVTDQGNHRVRRVSMGEAGRPVTSPIGRGGAGDRGGTAGDVMLGAPFALRFDPTGGLWVMQAFRQMVSRFDAPLTAASKRTVVAGGDGKPTGDPDGFWTDTRFLDVRFAGFDAAGRLIVADSGQHRIRAITREGWVTTIAGGEAGFADGDGATARFKRPFGAAIGPDGAIYVLDADNYCIRRIKKR